MKFSMKTTASPAKVMGVWKDVPNWKRWDYHLEYSKINGSFSKGTTGVMKSSRAREVKFVIDDLTKDKIVVSVEIPLSKLKITRTISPLTRGCTFTHETSFEGPVGVLYNVIFGRRFIRELPIVMGKVKQIAES